MGIRTYRQRSNDEMLKTEERFFASGKNANAVITSVFTKDGTGEWRYLIGKCEFYDCQGDIKEIFSDMAFIRKTIKDFDLKEFLNALSGEGFVIDDHLPPIKKSDSNPINWSVELVPSYATKSGFSEREYSAKIEQQPQFNDGMLLGYDMEFFPSAAEYLKNFMGMSVYHGQSHGDNGEFSFLFPDHRGKIEFQEGKISVSGNEPEMCLVGEVFDKGKIRLKPPETLVMDERSFYKSELWLLSKENEVLDYRSNTHWKYQLSGADDDHEGSERILALVDEGEGQELEFKPYIDLTNNKACEIEKTVCAFSNAKGGHLLIGVSDEGCVEGIDTAVLGLYGGPIDRAIDEYIKEIKKRLSETLRYNQCFSISAPKVGEKHILVVLVERTERPNYYVNSELGFIRKGATSAKMKSTDEREKTRSSLDLFSIY